MEELLTASRVLDIAGPLLGTVVGGGVTWLVTRSAETRNWRRQRQERLAEVEREALAAALEWAEPMRNAQIKAESLVSRALRGHVESERLLAEWPDLMSSLTEMDLPAKLRAVLPKGAYARGIQIIHNLEELKHLAIQVGQEVELTKQQFLGLPECRKELDSLQAQIDSLEEDLRRCYRATFA